MMLGPEHHTPWGVVHGGVYTTAIESVASVGASLAAVERGQFAVGLNNSTDFLRPLGSGEVRVTAEAVHQGLGRPLLLEAGQQVLEPDVLLLRAVPRPDRYRPSCGLPSADDEHVAG